MQADTLLESALFQHGAFRKDPLVTAFFPDQLVNCGHAIVAISGLDSAPARERTHKGNGFYSIVNSKRKKGQIRHFFG
ncbi:MAG: hypothetical protein ACKO9H_05145 [Planctomycetota bacterium]